MVVGSALVIGATTTLISCEKEEITSETKMPSEVDNNNGIIDIDNDTTVISYATLKSCEALRTSQDAYYQGFVQDIVVGVGKNCKPAALSDYHKLNIDLNMGAGGDYLYLFVKTTNNYNYAINFINYHYNGASKSYNDKGKATGARPNGRYVGYYSLFGGDGVANLNKGCKRGNSCVVNLSIGRDESLSSDAIDDIMVIAKNTKESTGRVFKEGTFWYQATDDLNKGVDGKYVYIFTKGHKHINNVYY